MQNVRILCVVGLLINQLPLDDQLAIGVISTVTYHCVLLITCLNTLPNTKMILIGYTGLEIFQLTMFGVKLEVNNWRY